MTPAERHQRELARVRAAGAAVADAMPPLSEERIERLAFILAPTVASITQLTTTALPQAA
jgi:hypothetical protein